MPAPAELAHRSVVRIGRGATPTWTTLAGVGDFETPDIQAAEEDATSHSSPLRQTEEIPGFLSAVDWSAPINHIGGSAQGDLLLDLYRSGETVLVEITAPGDGARTWTGYVKGYKVALPVKGKMMATLTLRIAAEVVASGGA